MTVKKQLELSRSLESVVGAEHVTTDHDLQIDGLRPSLVARPGSTAEVVECLKLCAEADAAVVPAGFMTWLECGNPIRRVDVVLSLARMNRIIDYSPADLTATVEAGLALSEFNAEARPENQWLPLDPPGSTVASLGAIAACASSGPLRHGFGAVRDYVIGLRLAHLDGTESKAGGRVVKNVAGYDMNKLYVGSFGTLAAMTELTFKLRPLPDRSATVLVSGARLSLVRLASLVLSSELQPASIFLVRGVLPDSRARAGADALLLRFIESETVVDYQLNRIASLLDEASRATVLNEADALTVWKQVADLDRLAENAVRLSVPLSKSAEMFDALAQTRRERAVTADFGAGIIRTAFDADAESAIEFIQSLRRRAVSIGGTLFIERAPSRVRQRADAWGDAGRAAEIMKAIKSKFDSQGLLNSGRFVAGI